MFKECVGFYCRIKKKYQRTRNKKVTFILALRNTRYPLTISSSAEVRYQAFPLDHFCFWCLDSGENARTQMVSCYFIIDTWTTSWYMNFYPGVR